jgi:surface protein
VTKANGMLNAASALKTLRLGQNFTFPKMTTKATNCFNGVPKTMEVEVHSNYMTNVRNALKNKLGFAEGSNGELVEYDKKTAQAIWTSGNSTMTFYYGKQYKVGDSFDGNRVTKVWSGTSVTSTPMASNKVPWTDDVSSKLKTVRFHESFAQVRPTRLNGWFYECAELQSIYGTANLNTAVVSTMYKMCYNCGKLTAMDVSGFDTHNVTDMSYAFSGCEKLTQLKVAEWNTAKVTSMAGMFNKCRALATLDPGKWDTGKVVYFSSMFYYCEKLTSLNLDKWNTVSATTMSYMFYGCSRLSDLKISNFDTSKVTTMKGMFGYCAFTNRPYYGFNTKSCTDMSYMFYNCAKMECFFTGSSFVNNSSKVKDMSYMFNGCAAMTSMSGSKLNTAGVTTMAHMFDGCKAMRGFHEVADYNTANVTDMSYMFRDCSASTYFPVSGWNTAKVTNMSYMFRNCAKATNIDAAKWNTAAVTTMAYMFSGCAALGPTQTWMFSVKNWNVAKVKSFDSMFEMTNLRDIDLSGWNTASCTNFSYMFYKCPKLERVTLGQNFAVPASATRNSPFSSVKDCTLYVYRSTKDAAKTIAVNMKFTKNNGYAYQKTATTSAKIDL